MMMVKSILPSQQELPHAVPDIIKCIVEDIFEIEPVILLFLFHNFTISWLKYSNVQDLTKKYYKKMNSLKDCEIKKC